MKWQAEVFKLEKPMFRPPSPTCFPLKDMLAANAKTANASSARSLWKYNTLSSQYITLNTTGDEQRDSTVTWLLAVPGSSSRELTPALGQRRPQQQPREPSESRHFRFWEAQGPGRNLYGRVTWGVQSVLRRHQAARLWMTERLGEKPSLPWNILTHHMVT